MRTGIRRYENGKYSWKCYACSSADYPYDSEIEATEALEAHEYDCEVSLMICEWNVINDHEPCIFEAVWELGDTNIGSDATIRLCDYHASQIDEPKSTKTSGEYKKEIRCN